MATRPTAYLPWANANPGVVVAPTTALINSGYLPSQKPAAYNFNYIVNLIFQWIVWFDFNIGSGVGGGGSALSWQESAQISPQPIVENNLSVYEYAPGNNGQSLIAIMEVPQGYNTGSPIKIYNRVYSPATTGTLLFQTYSTLVRTGVDPINSQVNQHVSSNAALTLSSSTVNVPQSVIYDVTDASGLINGISPNPGDLIIISLQRGADTAVGQARCITFASIPSFS